MENPWRIHLASSAIQYLDIIASDPSMVAVWTRDGLVAFYDLDRGSLHGMSEFALHESPEQWPALLASLKDPKGRPLPFARIGGLSVWPLRDGSSMTYYGRAKVSLDTGKGAAPQELTFDVKPAALAIDPQTQLVAALDPKGALLLGKPGGTTRTLKPGLTPVVDLPLSVAIAHGGKRIVVSDGNRLIVIDSGKVSSRRDLHYACGLIALSPDGEQLLSFDTDSGVLRAYVPDALRLTHQRFVIDLLSSAEERQLIGFAELPPVSAALNALTIDDAGRFVFAVFGQICAASIRHLSATEGAPTGGKSTTSPKAEPVSPAPKSVEKSAARPSAVTSGSARPNPAKPLPSMPAAKDTSPLKTPPIDGE